MIMGIQKAWTG